MKIGLILLVALPFAFPGAADAACLPALSVSATTLNFGVYDPEAASSDKSTGTITLQCTIGLLPSFNVALSTGGSGSYAMRQLANGSSVLAYNLYADSSHTMVWGDGTGGTTMDSFSGLISLGATNFTVYGRAPKGQYPAPGSFTDTITVTVTY
jgi:spore coat protein U-like protein